TGGWSTGSRSPSMRTIGGKPAEMCKSDALRSAVIVNNWSMFMFPPKPVLVVLGDNLAATRRRGKVFHPERAALRWANGATAATIRQLSLRPNQPEPA